MNRRLGISLAFALPALLFAAAPVQAQENNCGGKNIGEGGRVPTVTVCANGKVYEIPNVKVDGNLGFLQKTTIDLGGGASFTVSANFDSDPSSLFSFGSTIPGGFGVVNFDAYFTTPVVGGPYNFAHSYYTADLTLIGVVGVSAPSAFYAVGTFPTYVSGYTELGPLGVDVGSATCSLSVPSTISCPPGDKTNTVSPITPTTLTARLSYSQGTNGTGAISTANFQGGVELTNVTTVTPEPTAIAMMSVGLLLLGGVVRKRLFGA